MVSNIKFWHLVHKLMAEEVKVQDYDVKEMHLEEHAGYHHHYLML